MVSALSLIGRRPARVHTTVRFTPSITEGDLGVPCGRTRLRCTGGGESDATHGALAKIEGALFSGVVPVSRLRASPVLLRNVSVLGGSLAARTSHEQRGA